MKTKFIAEMVGTMVLVLMGCGAAVLNGGATSVAAVLTIAFAFGLSVVAMAYTIGPVSGCHINPAITIGVWLNGGLSVMEAGVYIVAQVTGGILGSALLWLIASTPANNAGPMLRAGLTDVPVTGIHTICTKTKVNPIASPAK